MGMARAVINRSASSVRPTSSAAGDWYTSRGVSIGSKQKSLRTKKTKTIRPKTMESASLYGRIVSGRRPRNQTVCTKERRDERMKEQTKRRNERNEERKPLYISFVCCKPFYNQSHEPPWETDSPSKASVTGTRLFVPQTIRTIDVSYHGFFVPSVDFSYPSYHGLFVPFPWTFRTIDVSYHRRFVP